MPTFPETQLASSRPETADTAAVVTLPAIPGRRYRFGGITWSYRGDPTNGELTITGTDPDEFSIYIEAAGPDSVPVEIRTQPGEEVVITLTAGGDGVFGTLNVSFWPD